MNIVNVGYDSTNYYVIEQGRHRLLVDVGCPGTLSKFRASLKRKGLAIEDLTYMFATHYHPDHAGLVQDLKQLGVKHLVFEQQLAAVPLLKTQVKPDSGYLDIRLDGSLRLKTSESRVWLANIGLAGEMVSTRGHSDDSITLVLDEGLAFTGDLTAPGMFEDEQGDLIAQSWAKLRALNVRTIYPGHGPVRPLR